MKKRFLTHAAVATALAAFLASAIAVSAPAQEKAVPPKAAPASEAAKKEASAPERKAVPKPPASFLTGAIDALDEAKGTLTVKSRKGVVKDFVADEKARNQLKTLKVGDRVVVKHVDGTALSIVKPGVKKKEAPPPRDSAPKQGMSTAPEGRK